MPLTTDRNVTTLDKAHLGVKTDMTSSTKWISSLHSSRHVSRSGQDSGFTLTELLIVLAIAAILMAAAVPSFKSMNHNMAVRGAANELIAGIQFARSEAIRANQTVTLSLDGRTWRVFVDTKKNHALDDNEELLRESSYSELITAQNSALWFDFAPIGTITSSSGSFPATICLTTADDSPAQRQILFPARASSPVVQTGCN